MKPPRFRKPVGEPAAKGKKVSPQTFSQMLINPLYAGWLEVDGWGEHERGDFDPLVNQETFDRVQALCSGKRVTVTPHLRNHPDFPLRNFVKCGCCDRPLTASYSTGRTQRYPYYHCQNRHCRGVRVRKVDLECAFPPFLEQFQPKPKYLKLFNEIVRDVWREKQAESVTLTANLKRQIKNLEQRKERLDETFIFDKAIDRETYQRQLDKLNEQIMLAEGQERDAKLESYDVEPVLNFAEHVILNAPKLWIEIASDQKQRLQKVFFPQGVTFENGNYGTAETCIFFNMIPKIEEGKSSLATLPGIEPGLPP
jgi:site-specific DNA recombinase